MTINIEAPEDWGIMLTDEVLPSLPLYMSKVGGLLDEPEHDAMFEATELEFGSSDLDVKV
jgi:hypothetical protein